MSPRTSVAPTPRTILALALRRIGDPRLADLIAEEIDAYIAIVDDQGRILHVNEAAGRAYGANEGELAGRPIGGMHERAVSQERQAVREYVFQTRDRVAVLGMLLGTLTRTYYYPFDYEHADLDHPFAPEPDGSRSGRAMLCMARRVTEFRSSGASEQVRLIRAGRHELGALGRLTERELEVLYLTAQGQRSEDIAAQLHRTRRTIESHRLRIAKKIGARNVVQLARLAVECGLTALAFEELPELLGSRDPWTVERLTRER